MCARAGEVLPHYAPLFVNAFLSGTASPLPALRCSAVSALATLCAKLRYALQPHLVDIVPPACHMLAMEAEVEVRRAAAYLLAELVAGAFRQPLPLRAGCRGCVQRLCVTIASAGVEDTFWEVLPEWLGQLYRTLQRAHEGDADDVTRNHAGRGLEVIGEKARAFLFPETRVQHPKILELG